jgi:hypothetical protein
MPLLTAPSRLLKTIVLLLLAVLLIVPTSMAQTPAVPATPATAPAYDPASLHAIRPELREEIAAALPAGLSEYDISLTFPDDPAGRVLGGDMTVTYTNTTGAPLTELPFRLYANSAAEGSDAVTMESIMVDGEDVVAEMSQRNSVARLPLPDSLDVGEVSEIAIRFTTTVPVDDPAHYGIFNYASETGTWSLAHWYPVVAGRDPQGGWMLDSTSVNGDPIFTDTGMYTVTIMAPDDLQFITSGVRIDSVPAGEGITATTWSAAPSRDFVMLADADMESVRQDVDGTTVTSWFHGGNAGAGEAALVWSARSLDLFNDLLGEYPYANLQVSEAAMFNAAGVEYPQLFTVGSGYYRRAPELNGQGYFQFTVAHEVVHQWFYGIVGNNQYDDAFIDEGLTNYLSSRVYFSAMYGEEIGEEVFERNIAAPFRYMIESNSDVIISTGTDAFPSAGAYVDAVYVKAPMGFFTIHEEIGDDAFFDALQDYVEAFRFRVATPADLLAAFDAVADVEIGPIWMHWFDRREGGLDIRD